VDKSITAPEYATFLRALRSARKAAGVTQTELAARIGETQSFVSKCERGERRLDVIELRTFCRAFGLSLTAFTQRLDKILETPAGSRKRMRRPPRRKN
jgi:transcriptional regulator with XRE-family HTH domain